jgi:hypothetical protein
MKKTKKIKKTPKKQTKVKVVMEEFKKGKLRSGSKKGPRVTNPKQAIAIALSEQRKVSNLTSPRLRRAGKKKK